MNHETGRRDPAENANADKVRKVIEDVCKLAGASVAVEQRLGEDGDESQPRQRLHVIYTGEQPMPYTNWFKLVDTIDAALDSSSSELIDWESSELSEETEPERMATWTIAPSTAQ